MRPDNLQHRHVVFYVWALYLKMIQESEDMTRSRMCPRSRRETAIDLDLIVPASKLSHDELEGDVSAA